MVTLQPNNSDHSRNVLRRKRLKKVVTTRVTSDHASDHSLDIPEPVSSTCCFFGFCTHRNDDKRCSVCFRITMKIGIICPFFKNSCCQQRIFLKKTTLRNILYHTNDSIFLCGEPVRNNHFKWLGFGGLREFN